MSFILVKCKAGNYSKWRNAFDDAADMRKKGGEINSRVFQHADNEHEMVILMEWEDHKKAKKFVQSKELRACMKKAGIIGKPGIYLLNEIIQ